MSENHWRLDGFMFQLALEAFGRDRLPYPLRYTVEGIEAHDDYLRARAEAGQRLGRIADHRLHGALQVLLEPQVRVEVHGFFGRDFAQVVRIHAGVEGDRATVAVQLPGPTQQYGRDVLLSHCPARAVARHVVAQLPRCVEGRHAPIRGRRSDLGRTDYAQHPTRLSHTEELNRILRRPRSGLGEITVYRGAAYDSRPTNDGRGFHWLDYLPADGRYLLYHQGGEDFTVTPGAPEEIERQLTTLIESTHRPVARRW
ncbi:ESX secretion-associated protein EspG [Nocardia xishanensis]